MEDLPDDGQQSLPSEGSPERAILEALGVALAEVTLAGEWMAVNHPVCELLGVSSEELVGKAFGSILRPQSPQSHGDGLHRLVTGATPVYSSEMMATRSDGQQVWIKAAFSLVRDAETERPDHLLLAIEDVTPLRRARKALRDSERAREQLARRLITTQEAERTRIARELHDDIGQSLAVLKIQMMRAGQPQSGRAGKAHPSLSELAGRIQSVAEKVGRLSHQLHSSELEFLGLAVAVKSHCREVAERYKLTIECACTNVPDELDNSLALSFLRVVQEALHNISKHALATQVRVTLTGAGTELDLTVTDNGVGFDVEHSRSAAGLGLVSMRERLHLVGGELAIFSTPGKGTRVQARAPFAVGPEVDLENL